MMALGYFLKAIRLFNDGFLKQLNNLCFKVFLPLILFINVYSSDFKGAFSLRLVLFAVFCVVACFAALMLIVPLFEKDNQRRGVIIQGIFRSNYILFGLPITASLFGEKSVSIPSILVAFVVPLYNVFSVIALESFCSQKTSAKKIVRGVATNPLIIGAVIAFIFVLTGFKLPVLVEKTVTDISKIATPLALIILGGSFSFKGLDHSVKALFLSVLGKLVFVPLIFVPISILFGFRGVELAALFAMFASPTAVSSFTMAESLGADSNLAGQIVVMDSLLSIASIFVWITVLRQMRVL